MSFACNTLNDEDAEDEAHVSSSSSLSCLLSSSSSSSAYASSSASAYAYDSDSAPSYAKRRYLSYL